MSREFTNKLHDMVAEDRISEGHLLACCLIWMSEDDVKDMCNNMPELAELFEEIYLDIVEGDEVYWNDPDEGACSGKYIVMSIDTDGGRVLSGDDMVTIGNSLEDFAVPASEIE